MNGFQITFLSEGKIDSWIFPGSLVESKALLFKLVNDAVVLEVKPVFDIIGYAA